YSYNPIYKPYHTSNTVHTLTLVIFSFFFHSYVPHRDLHSFPTRRSSDLARAGAHHRDGKARARNGRGRLRANQQCGHATGHHSRSEEHTSELQSLAYLVCRLLLEKKK